MKDVIREIFSTVAYILVVLAATYLLVTFVGQRTGVSGSSMEPTLSDGDNLIVDKIVFPFLYEKGTYYIKRIIGLPGETVYIDENGVIYIDGKVLEENYGRETILSAGRAAQPVQLGEDEYFVMGDNRNNSSDSRDPSVGNIKRDNIIGKAWVRIWPLSKFGKLRHR